MIWLSTAITACLTVGAAGEVVLLQNGATLSGSVATTNSGLEVRGSGTAIRLRSEEIAFVGTTAESVYEWLRGQFEGPAISGLEHLRLADWCLENSLHAQAARELLDARQAGTRNPRLDLLERRLDEELRRASSPPSQKPSPRQPLNKQPRIAAANPSLPKLPSGGLHYFTRRIQPLLLNGCAASGCHSELDDNGSFALDRSSLHGHGDHRSTGRNLRVAYEAIRIEQPKQSPLLTAAKGPHHGHTPFAGARRAELLARIEAWVLAVAAANSNADTEPSLADQNLTESVATELAGRTEIDPKVDEQVVPASFEAEPTAAKRGAQLVRQTARDEFDPATFNKRFRRDSDDQPTVKSLR